MTLPVAPAPAAITEAVAWLKQSAWTTRADDFEVARQVVGRGGTSPGNFNCSPTPSAALPGPTQSTVQCCAAWSCVPPKQLQARRRGGR